MYDESMYDFVIHLLHHQYEKLGGEFLPYEYAFLLDAAKSGMLPFIRAIKEMFGSHLDIALMGAVDSCMIFAQVPIPLYSTEELFGGIALLEELICNCCPLHAGKAAEFLEEARFDASIYFSSFR